MQGFYAIVMRPVTAALLSLLVACGAEQAEEPPLDDNEQIEKNENSGNDAASDQAALEADIEAACASYPDLPFCNKDPRPGFAKFAVGAADGVRWSGDVSCREIDVRTGKHGEERLTKSTGKVMALCHDKDVRFEFVYRQLKKTLSPDAWVSAFRPLSVDAARRLLESCTSDSQPEPSAVMNSWWKANNTYAENLMLDFTSPIVFATKLLPFSDEGIERLGEEAIDGVETIQFRNDEATVWMFAESERERPRRVVLAQENTDVHFTEWDKPFAADMPEGTRSLSEVCALD